MIEEQKQILLQDLSSRLPYRVKVCCIHLSDNMPKVWDLIGIPAPHLADILVEGLYRFSAVNIEENIRPYLRSLSSMTEEEKEELENIEEKYFGQALDKQIKECLSSSPKDESRKLEYFASSKIVDYLNKHHFDYHGLIEKGLAVEAPEEMYKF